MKKSKVTILVSVLLALLILAAVLVVFLMKDMSQESSNEIPEPTGARTFADWTDAEVFKTVPAMIVEGTRINDAASYGAKNYVLNVAGTTVEDYKAYLQLLEQEGYTKYADNGPTGLEEAVYNATYEKGSLAVTVTQMVKMEKTYISVREHLPLSEHLFYKDEYVANNKAGAKTTLHMMELYDFGNSFVIQLKNGHFIINDGGTADDLPYLLDYLESLVPNGEIPVIEAWILTHAHHDHMGLFEAFSKHPEYGKRIYVDGVYYNEIDGNTIAKVGGSGASNLNRNMTFALNGIKTSTGEEPQVYRPQTGQRYYFNDVTIDIVFAQEQLITDNYFVEVDNLNDSSTWCMYTIEGQKFLISGDASRGSMQSVMRTYESEYFDLDLFAIFHHGINSWPTFTDYMSAETVLFTFATTHSQREDIEMGSEANKLLMERAKDYYAWGDGTVVFTFPYVAGTAKTLKPNDWKYHDKREPEWLAWYPDYASKYAK